MASMVDYYAIIKNKKTTTTENWFCHNCYQICVSFLGLPKTQEIQRLGYFMKSNYFPRVSLPGERIAAHSCYHGFESTRR